MASKQDWRQRVADWRASGLKAPAFCSGKGYSARELWQWTWRLGLTAKRRSAKPKATAVPLARVVPGRVETATPKREGARLRNLEIRFGGVHMVVAPEFDVASLAVLVQALAKASCEGRPEAKS